MAWGRLFDKKVQYQQGVYNGISGGFFNLDRGVDYRGDVDWTPWKGTNGLFDSFGGGISMQTGWHQFSLAAGATNNFVNGAGEPTVNPVYVNSTGIPFFVYAPNMITDGQQRPVSRRTSTGTAASASWPNTLIKPAPWPTPQPGSRGPNGSTATTSTSRTS